MARKHPHLFANEIKGISPRTFGVELTGSGYGIAAAITGISNDFPHTNPRNAYLYDRLLREYFRNCNNTVTDGLIHNDNLDLFPNNMDAGFTPNEYNFANSYFSFFENDPASNIQLITGTPLTTYSGHCVTFNGGEIMFNGNNDIEPPPGVNFEAISPCIQRLIGSKAGGSVGPTGFYRTLKITGTKFNTPEAKAATNSNGGPIRKVILDNKGKSKMRDIFFRTQFTGEHPFATRTTQDIQHGIGGSGHIEGHGQSIRPGFTRQDHNNNFLDLGRNGTFGPLATGMKYKRTLSNNSKLTRGYAFKLLFTRVQNRKIVEHLQHEDFPISGISYLDLFEQNFDIPRKDGVHVHVFNFGKVKIQQNQAVGGPDLPRHSQSLGGGSPTQSGHSSDKYYKNFQQSGNPKALFTGGKIDFSAFNLYTALLD